MILFENSYEFNNINKDIVLNLFDVKVKEVFILCYIKILFRIKIL